MIEESNKRGHIPEKMLGLLGKEERCQNNLQ